MEDKPSGSGSNIDNSIKSTQVTDSKRSSIENHNESLFASMAEVNVAIDHFFKNNFVEAKTITAQKSDSSMYHAIGYTTLLFLEAALTFEHEDINKAMVSIKDSLQVCNRFRKKKQISTAVTKILGFSQNELTEEERHAELVFAELNMYRAALTFVQDENLISFIRGALKIRTCYQTYSHCYKQIEKMKRTSQNMQYISGVLLGWGFFNVSLSLLPPRIVSLLEWFGFTADKDAGMQQLIDVFKTPSLRSTTAALFILSYNLFLTVHFSTHDINLNLTSSIICDLKQKYPDGFFFHLFSSRLKQIQGNFESAAACLRKVTSVQLQWKQFSHICYWELMWCYAHLMEWDKAAHCAELLKSESNWSKLVYTYMRASFLIMQDKVQHKSEINSLMKQVPVLQQRLAGKSIPTEKFLLRKSKKYFQQSEYLLLPVHEMLYCWTGLTMLKENEELRNKHLDLINNAFQNLNQKKDKGNSVPMQSLDDYCLLQLLKGNLLYLSGEIMRAELCLIDVRENYPGISKDHYLTPAAMTDLVWVMIDQKRFKEATELLKYTKKTYSNYSMESRLHFRMHAAQTKLDQIFERSNAS